MKRKDHKSKDSYVQKIENILKVTQRDLEVIDSKLNPLNDKWLYAYNNLYDELVSLENKKLNFLKNIASIESHLENLKNA